MAMVPSTAPDRVLSPASLALRHILESVAQSLWSEPWRTGLTTLAWQLAVEPVGTVDLGPGVDTVAADEARRALAWWADRGEMWLVEGDDGLRELPIPHWIASQTPIEEPASALADPNVQLAVAMAPTRCARCGVEIAVGDPFGLVKLPGGPGGWCCQDCVVGESTSQ